MVRHRDPLTDFARPLNPPVVGKHFHAAVPQRRKQRLALPLRVLHLLSLRSIRKGISTMHHYIPHALGVVLVIIAIVVILADR